MPKTAIVDIDNTLWQFCDAFYEELFKINKSFPTIEYWTSWEVFEGYCTKAQFYGAVNAIHEKQTSDNYLPYPEAKGFLSSLKENGYHITIASHRAPIYREQTEQWLGKHGLIYDELHLSFHKTELISSLTDVVVDDSPDVLEKAVEHGVKATGLLFPWNRAYSGNGFYLCSSLDEILSHIVNEERKW